MKPRTRKGWRVGGHRPALHGTNTSPKSKASLSAHGALNRDDEFLYYDPEDTEYHMDQNDLADAMGGSPWGDD